jgi:DNA invertase Pin-like site-specific DNA recombinase
MKAKRAAVYLRCSTKSQETEMQEVELTEYVTRRGWECKIYRDSAQSGAKERRPALDSLLSDVRKRRVDVLCVWAWDRLARSLKQLLSIAEECRSLGVDLVSLKQNVDTTLPAGRLTFQVLGAVAEFEREMLRTRVKAGLEMARRDGKRLGRPALRRFDADQISEIRQLRRRGTSVRSLAIRFGTTQYIVNKLGDGCENASTPKN